MLSAMAMCVFDQHFPPLLSPLEPASTKAQKRTAIELSIDTDIFVSQFLLYSPKSPCSPVNPEAHHIQICINSSSQQKITSNPIFKGFKVILITKFQTYFLFLSQNSKHFSHLHHIIPSIFSKSITKFHFSHSIHSPLCRKFHKESSFLP